MAAQPAHLYFMINNPTRYELTPSYSLSCCLHYAYNSPSPITPTNVVKSKCRQSQLHVMTNNSTKYEHILSYCIR